MQETLLQKGTGGRHQGLEECSPHCLNRVDDSQPTQTSIHIGRSMFHQPTQHESHVDEVLVDIEIFSTGAWFS